MHAPRSGRRDSAASTASQASLPSLAAVRGPRKGVTYARVDAPMSIANVGPGFDHFGLCLDAPCDRIEVWRADTVRVEVRGDSSIPTEPERNTATIAARSFANALGTEWTWRVRIVKGCPGGSGLGSSAASAVGGALAAAVALGQDPGNPKTAAAILRAAADGEAYVSGDVHLDNVSASLFGGFTLVERTDPPIVHRLPVPPGFRAVVCLPSLRIETKAAREVLPREIPRADAIANVAHASALVRGWLSGDLEAVGRNLVDRLAEPYRSSLLPGGVAVREAAQRSGALGVALSGSGPAIWALARPRDAARVAAAMRRAWGASSISARTFVARAGTGASLVARR